jgi:hypothetical protein
MLTHYLILQYIFTKPCDPKPHHRALRGHLSANSCRVRQYYGLSIGTLSRAMDYGGRGALMPPQRDTA